jgi:hypothetical protein
MVGQAFYAITNLANFFTISRFRAVWHSVTAYTSMKREEGRYPGQTVTQPEPV